MAENNNNAQSGKRVIRLQAPIMEKPLTFRCTQEMENMSIKQVLDLVAEQYVQQQNPQMAQIIRSLASRDIVHNRSMQHAETKIKDLRFEIMTTNSGEAMVADLSFESTHAGGK